MIYDRHNEPASDLDTAVVDSLKALDPERPIREADIKKFNFLPRQNRRLNINEPVSNGDRYRVRPIGGAELSYDRFYVRVRCPFGDVE